MEPFVGCLMLGDGIVHTILCDFFMEHDVVLVRYDMRQL